MTCGRCQGICHAIQPQSKAQDVLTQVWWCPTCKYAFEVKDGVKQALFEDGQLKDFFGMNSELKDLASFLKLDKPALAAFMVLATNFGLQQWMNGFKSGLLLGLTKGDTDETIGAT